MASTSEESKEKVRKWNRVLLWWVAGMFLFEIVSGLSVYLLPFSITTQSMVLIHTITGLGLVVPYIIYQLKHWLSYRPRKMTGNKLTGYFAFAAAAVLIVSGLVVTWDSLFTLKISYLWDKIHLISTFAFLLAVVPHIVLVVFRDLRARENPIIQPIIKAEQKFGLSTITIFGIQLLILGLFIYAYQPIKFDNRLPSNYNYMYGANKPFAPSLARTNTNQAIDSRLLGGSESCASAGCHAEIGKEWEASAHRYSAMDPAFRAVQATMAKQKGPEATRYCGGCHDPISLFAGSKNLSVKTLTNKTGFNEGISCVTCHSITKVDVQGNAQYQVTAPKPYMFELKKGKAAELISDFLIRAYPKQHIDEYERTLLKTPEFCGSCHKQFIDKQVNGVGWVQLQNQYDNWRKSHWNHPGNAKTTIECRECHMPLVATPDPGNGDSLDYNRTPNDGKHRSHRFLGGNQLMPTLLHLPDAKQQVALINKWLKGKIQIPEIKDKWHNGPAIKIALNIPDSVTPGKPVSIGITATNNKPGHNFPTGPLDLIQAWLQITVKDQNGNIVYSSGKLNNRHFIPPGTFVFKAEPVDQYGNIIDHHNLWDLIGVKFSRTLFPGFSDMAHFSFVCPKAHNTVTSKGTGPSYLTVTAKLNYRKFNQYITNLVFGSVSKGITAPVTVISSAHGQIRVLNKLTSRP